MKKKLKEIEEETGNLRQKSALIEKEIGGAAEGEIYFNHTHAITKTQTPTANICIHFNIHWAKC